MSVNGCSPREVGGVVISILQTVRSDTKRLRSKWPENPLIWGPSFAMRWISISPALHVLGAELNTIPALRFCKSDPRCLRLRTQKMRTHQLVATHGKPHLYGFFISHRNSWQKAVKSLILQGSIQLPKHETILLFLNSPLPNSIRNLHRWQ